MDDNKTQQQNEHTARAPVHIMSLYVLGNASESEGRGGTDGTSSGERK